jgi:hypothetical protein
MMLRLMSVRTCMLILIFTFSKIRFVTVFYYLFYYSFTILLSAKCVTLITRK